MATERLIIEIDEKGSIVVKRNIEAVGKTAARSESAVGLLRRALGLLATGAILKQLAGYADAFTRIQNQIRGTIESTDQLAVVTQALFDVAQRTRQDFESTVEVYDRLSSAQDDLGISQERAIKLQEQFNQAVLVSGGSLSQSSEPLNRFITGLADGSLKGVELTRVLNQLPGVAQVIADHLGTTRGELAKLADQGKITTSTVIAAFDSQEEKLRKQAEGTVPTLREAFTVLNNSLTKTVGELDKTTGASAALADVIIDLAGAIEELKDPTSGIGEGVKNTILGALSLLRAVAQITDALLGSFIAVFNAGRATGEAFRVISENLKRGRLPSAETLKALGKDIGTSFVQGFSDAPVTNMVDNLIDNYIGALETQGAAREGEISDTVRKTLLPTSLDLNAPLPEPKARIDELKSSLIDIEDVSGGELEGDFEGAFERIRQDAGETGQALTAAFSGAFGAIDEFIHGTDKSFSEMAASILADIASILAQSLLLKAITAAFPGAAPFMPGFASGGNFTVGGAGGTDSQVVAFRATPGEEVSVTPKGNGGAGASAPTPIKNVTVFDPNMLLDAISSPAGERVVMNVIQRNPSQIRKVLS